MVVHVTFVSVFLLPLLPLTFVPLVVVPFALIQFILFVALNFFPIFWSIIEKSVATIDRFVLICESIQKSIGVTVLGVHVVMGGRPFQRQKQGARYQETQQFGRIPSQWLSFRSRRSGKHGRMLLLRCVVSSFAHDVSSFLQKYRMRRRCESYHFDLLLLVEEGRQRSECSCSCTSLLRPKQLLFPIVHVSKVVRSTRSSTEYYEIRAHGSIF